VDSTTVGCSLRITAGIEMIAKRVLEKKRVLVEFLLGVKAQGERVREQKDDRTTILVILLYLIMVRSTTCEP